MIQTWFVCPMSVMDVQLYEGLLISNPTQDIEDISIILLWMPLFYNHTTLSKLDSLTFLFNNNHVKYVIL